MSAPVRQPAGATAAAGTVPRLAGWHRPLLAVAAVMVLLTLFTAVARFVDPLLVTGAGRWDKPLKFAISTLIYAVTWAWLLRQVTPRWRRPAGLLGTVIAIALTVELVIIAGAAAAGTTSHFNIGSPTSTALWTAMAVSISVLWVATFVLAVLLCRSPLGGRARTAAVRLGALLSVLGLGLGYLMVSPTAAQLADFRGVAGAHTVGLADGGPGLPVLGWSTVAGDLRIPHFVGMHALQVLPLVLLAVQLLARRLPALADDAVQTRLVHVTAAGHLGLVGLVTWQALRGQSIVRPDALTAGAGALLVTAVVAGVAIALRRGAQSAGSAIPVRAATART